MPSEPGTTGYVCGEATHSVREALQWAARKLAESESARLDAQLLLGHVLGRGRAWLLAHGDEPVQEEELRVFKELVSRRTLGEPIAYLRGVAYWRDLDLAVGPGVLVPRPETELLVDVAVGLAASRHMNVVDIGTGSGAIAIAVARALPDAREVAVDMSAEALLVARTNVERYGVSAQVELRVDRLLGPIEEEPGLILANLPYLSAERMETLPRDVRFEPEVALAGGEDGLDLYRELVRQARKRGWRANLVVEIDPEQREAMEALLRQAWPSGKIGFERDLAGRVRVAVCEPGSEQDG